MTCYKRSMLEEDANSMGSIHLSEGVSSTTTHIRYHGGSHEICYIENLGAKQCAAWRLENRKKTFMILLYSGIFALLMFGVFAVISLRAFSAHSNDYIVSHKTKLPYCLTEKCIRTSSYLLSSMNHEVNPCENFYDFACGRWTLANPVPDGKAMWGMFNQLDQANQQTIKNILERRSMASELYVAETLTKRYYSSCMDSNEITEKLGAEPLLNLLKDIGGWSIIDKDFNVSKWDFQRTLEKVQNDYNIPLAGLFSWTVGQNDRNSSQNIIQIDQNQLTLPATESYKNLTDNKKLYNSYLESMTKLGILLGGEPNSTEKQMKDIIKFERELAAIMESDEARRDQDKSYHQCTIADLQKDTPFIDWKLFFSNAFQVTNNSITEDRPVVVYAIEFLKKLDKLLKNYVGSKANPSKKRILHNYLGWQAVRLMYQYLTKQFRESMKSLKKAIYGTEGITDSWRFCVGDTNNVLGFAIGALYAREAFHGDSKTKAKQMINNIKAAFKENFEKLKWMDKQTSELAKKKVNTMTDMIGFPDYITDISSLNESYSGLEIKDDEYFMNNIRICQFRFKEILSKLDQPVNRSKWLMVPTTVNAYYSPNTNSIVFPAGILQAPFYDQDQLLVLNYGAIGVVMGHEMTHAFDDQGREYDMYGNLNQWWKNETIDKFKNATECVVKQYSNFRINDKVINGIRTLGENIADNGGLKAAYHAYQKLSKKQPSSFAYPGLNYTENQLFFISFAQVWCSANNNETTNLQIEKDTHVPSVFRVNGPVQNLKEFSEVFNCPKNSKMNPEMKCEIW